MNNLLVFDLGGGFADMIKTILCIVDFTSKNNFKFTIRYCTCRPQDKTKPVSENIKLNNYSYDVTNLFDEKTFLIYDNYVPYNTVKEKIIEENTYDFYTDKILGNLFDNNKKEYMNNV